VKKLGGGKGEKKTFIEKLMATVAGGGKVEKQVPDDFGEVSRKRKKTTAGV